MGVADGSEERSNVGLVSAQELTAIAITYGAVGWRSTLRAPRSECDLEGRDQRRELPERLHPGRKKEAISMAQVAWAFKSPTTFQRWENNEEHQEKHENAVKMHVKSSVSAPC